MLTIGMVCEINAPTESPAFKIKQSWERFQPPKIVKLVSKGTDLSPPSYWEVQAVEGDDETVFAVYDAWLVEAGSCLRFFPKCPRRIRAGWYREYGGTCS
jgi:hypothetical protein